MLSMAEHEEAEVFDFDEEDRQLSGAKAQSSSHHADLCNSPRSSQKHSLDPFRRATLQIEADEDVCSICLDAFTDEDPGNATICEHTFHLQCIMQWAQRSKECPLCFKLLALQDPELQSLLPFGEYVPPDHSGIATSALLGIEPWDVDRLLQRLALQNGANTGRRSRQRGRSRTYSMQSAQTDNLRSGQETAADPAVSAGDLETSNAQANNGDFPSSWPSSGTARPSRRSSSETEGFNRLKSGGGPIDLKSAGESLKSRWSNFQSRWRESLGRASRSNNKPEGSSPQ